LYTQHAPGAPPSLDAHSLLVQVTCLFLACYIPLLYTQHAPGAPPSLGAHCLFVQVTWLFCFLMHLLSIGNTSQRSVGLARTTYVRCIYGDFGREVTKYTVIYGVYIRFWLTKKWDLDAKFLAERCVHEVLAQLFIVHNHTVLRYAYFSDIVQTWAVQISGLRRSLLPCSGLSFRGCHILRHAAGMSWTLSLWQLPDNPLPSIQTLRCASCAKWCKEICTSRTFLGPPS